MTLKVVAEPSKSKLYRLWIYSDDVLIGEYERSSEGEIERKKREISNVEALLLYIFKKHGPFQIRWSRQSKRIRVGDVEVGEIPKEMWEAPSWR